MQQTETSPTGQGVAVREIKFRALRIFTGQIGSDKKWVHSSFLHIKKNNAGEVYGLNLGGVGCQLETLGQFTGLHDRNGVEIYEGDVLSEQWQVVVYVDKQTGAFMVRFNLAPDINKPITLHKYLKRRYKAGTGKRDCVVYGNIHQNPELIK